MSMEFGELARRIAADRQITAQDVLAIRQAVWPDGQISQDEAGALFALNHATTAPSPQWCDFFVEAIGEYVVNQSPPRGYVDDAKAAWLIGQIDADGQVETFAELELLVRIFERAQNVPHSLKTYALRQVEHAVLKGTGPTRDGAALELGSVNSAEARLLRRAIFAPAGDRPAGIGPNEAEMLIRLKDASLGADNAPEWKELFVQGLGNYLQGFSAPAAQISRERAAELDAFLAGPPQGVSSFLSRMVSSRPDFAGARGQLSEDQSPLAGRDGLARDGEVVDTDERARLDAKLAADGQIDEYEQALLDFLAQP